MNRQILQLDLLSRLAQVFSSTALFRPNVHGVSPVIHFLWCSFLGNHGKLAIYGSPANAGPEILTFLG
jgi:hypothetical protein